MDFYAWLIVVIVPVLIASCTVIYYFMGRGKADE